MSAQQNQKSLPPNDNQTRSAKTVAACIDSLTPAELGILHWLGECKGSREIATIVDRSVRTVDNHIGSILRKLGAENRSIAGRLYLEYSGAVHPPTRMIHRRRSPRA